jgi:hypothetical protein
MYTDTEHDVAVREKAWSRFIGQVFLVPVLFALIMLALWVILATLITPGASGEDSYAMGQRILRQVLILVGGAFDLTVAGIVVHRLCWGQPQ